MVVGQTRPEILPVGPPLGCFLVGLLTFGPAGNKMNNTQMVVELKAAVAAAKQEHFNSYSTRKAAESLLECLRYARCLPGGIAEPDAALNMSRID